MSKIEGLFIGDIATLEPGGDRTGIYKNHVPTVEIQREGMVGDHQADRRFHGGPDKAVHQFSQRSYQIIKEDFPELANQLVPGTMGENLSAPDMDDENVMIGDIYRVGAALLQVSEPRRPCWKINAKFAEESLSKFVESNAITGWYYRVLESGRASVGEEIVLQERYPQSPSIASFTRTVTQHRPAAEKLEALLESIGLSAPWRKKLQGRLKFLRTNNGL